jgi:hypothetical protein
MDAGPASVEGVVVRYQFLVAGQMSDTVRAAFPELVSTDGPAGGTSMSGEVRDKSALRGLLTRFDDLGLDVVEMRQIPA